jgi:hypothetical protein
MKNRHRVSQVVSKLILVTAAGARCFTVAANIANCRSYCASLISWRGRRRRSGPPRNCRQINTASF